MVQKNNDIPIYAEEIRIEQPSAQKVIQETLNKFKQPIPTGFVKLNVEEGNYQFSTSSKWNDKPLSERYGFDYQGSWIQIDLPHQLMETLELEKGEDITYPLYLSSKVLERQPTKGAITIENEEEIFIDKPVSEKSAARELVKRLKELESLREKLEELEKDNRIAQLDAVLMGSAQIFAKQQGIIATLRAQLVKEQSKSGASAEYIQHLKEDISRLDEQKKELEQRITELNNEESKNKTLRDKELSDLRSEIQRLKNELLTQNEKDVINVLALCLEEGSKGLRLVNNHSLNNCQVYFNESHGTFHRISGRMNKVSISFVNLWNQIKFSIDQLNTANAELVKERGWWDKWMNDNNSYIYPWRAGNAWNVGAEDIVIRLYLPDSTYAPSYWKSEQDKKNLKSYVKEFFYKYYRDK